jgi:hypothetical protein
LLAAFVALSLTWGTTGKLYRGLDELDLTTHFQVLRSWLHFSRRPKVDIFRWGAASQFIIYLGLACRSGSYLIYGVNSTLVWILLATSSMLAHYSTFTLSFKGRYVHTKSTRFAGILSIILRRLGKILASLNTVWIILACLFQFGSVFDRCWCNSSVFYLRNHAYNVIHVGPEDVAALNSPWIGGVMLAR